MTEAQHNLRNSWIKHGNDSDFSIYNIPFGIAKYKDHTIRVVTRIDDQVVNLYALFKDGYFAGIGRSLEGLFDQPTLNLFIDAGKKVTSGVRQRIQQLLDENDTEIANKDEFVSRYMIPYDEVEMMLPVKINNYTDFYSSLEHATNVGSIFRDPANPLMPNWRHLPVAYHGRASSIVVSGSKIHRPSGQILKPGYNEPVLSATEKLDFELEVAFVVGKSTNMGQSVPVNQAENYIFGFLLFNDLSARDIQSWEYAPLGPFLSKNFGSVISPWVVTLEALEPFKTQGPEQKPPVLDYLKTTGLHNFDINLEVYLKPDKATEYLVSATNHRFLYWNVCQQLAHHTINGCNITTGDLYASGTISGPMPGSYGSLLELTQNGKYSIKVGTEERTFLNDYDTVIIRGHSVKGAVRVGFGECEVLIVP